MTLEDKINTLREQAAAQYEEFTSGRDRINGNPDLSLVGRVAAIETLRSEHNAIMAGLAQKETELVSTRRRELEKSVFGNTPTNPSALISLRDAQDRADRLTDYQEALNLLDRAELNEDESLAQAVVIRAIEMGWSHVTDQYMMTRPDKAAALEELFSVRQYQARHALTGLHYIGV